MQQATHGTGSLGLLTVNCSACAVFQSSALSSRKWAACMSWWMSSRKVISCSSRSSGDGSAHIM